MICFKVLHAYQLNRHTEKKDIGIYSSLENAQKAIADVKSKVGFCDHPHGFTIKKVFRFSKPKLMDKTFWVDGFVTYTF